MNKAFLIAGLPRTRTAFLANLLSFGHYSFCVHEPTRNHVFEQLPVQRKMLQSRLEVLANRYQYPGISCSSLSLHENLRSIGRVVLVQRPHAEVRKALTKAMRDWGQPDPSLEVFDIMFEADRRVRDSGDYDYRIDFSDLCDPKRVRDLWEFCLRDTPWYEERFEELDRMRITVRQPEYFDMNTDQKEGN